MTSLFKVGSVPSDSYTATNYVYVNESEISKTGQRILINNYPFNVASDAAVPVGTIAMNGIQRKCVGVSSAVGDVIQVPQGGHTQIPPTISKIVVQLEYVTASKRGGTLDVGQTILYFQKHFVGQCFAEGQMLAVVLDPMSKYIGRIMSVFTTKDGKEVAVEGAGAIAELTANETNIIVSTLDKNEITVVNVPDQQLDSQQPNMIQKFDLESLGIGGLRAEFGQVFRRAFASRIFPQSVVKKLGIQHVKGVLLYGPPGTGKTLIAKKIGEILNCHSVKIVNGPEVLDKFVGGTEKKIRELFADAEAEQASKGDQSGLHLIIFDEFDSICKQRGSTRDSTGVADNAVNQLLSKIDGVNSLNNVLLIGMTNRKDLIDEAVLRPGRFEVHVEIGLPDEDGRVEVFRIHTRVMRDSDTLAHDVDLRELAKNSKNFSGAEIAGVVRSASSYALNRHIDFENPTETIDANEIKIMMSDFTQALNEVKPAFGQAKNECDLAMRGGIFNYGPEWIHVSTKARGFVQHIGSGNNKIQQLSTLIQGGPGTGKSAFAAHIAIESAFPYVKFISNNDLVTYGEYQKCNIIRKAFDDAHKSKLSVVVLDDIERLIEYSRVGGRYSNAILQTLLVLVKRPPPDGKKVIVIGTTSLDSATLEELEIGSCFSSVLHVSDVEPDYFCSVARAAGYTFKSPQDEAVIGNTPVAAPIQKLLLTLDMAADESRCISAVDFKVAAAGTLGDSHNRYV